MTEVTPTAATIPWHEARAGAGVKGNPWFVLTPAEAVRRPDTSAPTGRNHG